MARQLAGSCEAFAGGATGRRGAARLGQARRGAAFCRAVVGRGGAGGVRAGGEGHRSWGCRLLMAGRLLRCPVRAVQRSTSAGSGAPPATMRTVRLSPSNAAYTRVYLAAWTSDIRRAGGLRQQGRRRAKRRLIPDRMARHTADSPSPPHVVPRHPHQFTECDPTRGSGRLFHSLTSDKRSLASCDGRLPRLEPPTAWADPPAAMLAAITLTAATVP